MNRFLGKIFERLVLLPTVRRSIVSKKSKVCPGSHISFSSIGKYSYIGKNSLVYKANISSFVSIGDNCRIGGSEHSIDFVSSSPVFNKGRNVLKTNFQHFERQVDKEIIVGSDVWIGANAILISGVTIGTGAVIGAGSVVTHNVPPYEIWAGNPAKKIRCRFEEEIASELLKSKWWDLSDDDLKKYSKYFHDPKIFLEKIKK